MDLHVLQNPRWGGELLKRGVTVGALSKLQRAVERPQPAVPVQPDQDEQKTEVCLIFHSWRGVNCKVTQLS